MVNNADQSALLAAVMIIIQKDNHTQMVLRYFLICYS